MGAALLEGCTQSLYPVALAEDDDQPASPLLLDKPTTYLDINHQVELLDLLTDLNSSRGTTIIIVMHDLNLACRYADHSSP